MYFLCLLIAAAGCEDSKSSENKSWNAKGVEKTGDPAADGFTDEVPYSQLIWTFVGPDGQYPNAVFEGVRIKNLALHRQYFSFKYETNLSAWGYPKDHMEFACAFVKKDDGSWVGGKFDWISSADDSRIYHNILTGYNRWTLAGVPNPCEFAFVIVDARNNRRSNVLKGIWTR